MTVRQFLFLYPRVRAKRLGITTGLEALKDFDLPGVEKSSVGEQITNDTMAEATKRLRERTGRDKFGLKEVFEEVKNGSRR